MYLGEWIVFRVANFKIISFFYICVCVRHRIEHFTRTISPRNKNEHDHLWSTRRSVDLCTLVVVEEVAL